MGKLEKLIRKIYCYPVPKDLRYEEIVRLLISVGCIMQKRKGSSHCNFKHPDFPKIITLMECNLIRPYQVKLVKELLEFLDIVQED